MTYNVNITSQGQLTIPADLRRKFKLNNNGKAVIESRDDYFIVKPDRDPSYFRGIFKTNIKPKISFKKMHKAFEQYLAEEGMGIHHDY